MKIEKVTWIKRFEVDSLQIYFAASLEIQEELIAKGFHVPMSRDRKIETPIPIIYANYRGWFKEREPVTIERIIPLEWLELDAMSLGWIETFYNNKKAFYLSPEEVYVDIGVDDENSVYFKLDIRGYHLERVSIRGVNPEKWNNWAMFYISADKLNEVLKVLENNLKTIKPLSRELKVRKETQQIGKEITYYVYVSNREKVGIPIKYFSFCLGCFPLALRYFRVKIEETIRRMQVSRIEESIVDELKLRLEFDPQVNTGLKIGVAKILGKRAQVMFKLASNTPRTIKGVIKELVKGKARGKVVWCSHEKPIQYIVVDGNLLYNALLATQDYLNKLPSEEEHEKMLKKKISK